MFVLGKEITKDSYINTLYNRHFIKMTIEVRIKKSYGLDINDVRLIFSDIFIDSSQRRCLGEHFIHDPVVDLFDIFRKAKEMKIKDKIKMEIKDVMINHMEEGDKYMASEWKQFENIDF